MHLAIPVISGLVIGSVFVIVVALAMASDTTLSDEAIVAKYSKISEVRHFLEKHPDAQTEVERIPNEQATIVYFRVEKQVEPASEWNSGVNVLSVSAYVDKTSGRPTLGVDCGSQGMTIGVGIVDKITIDEWEAICFLMPSAEELGAVYPFPSEPEG
jgi:hypothetical protein